VSNNIAKNILQTIPNLTLVGWRGWWQRMEAESRIKQTKLGATEEWRKAKSRNNKEMKASFINRYYGIQSEIKLYVVKAA
jgi:hypothetical protein